MSVALGREEEEREKAYLALNQMVLSRAGGVPCVRGAGLLALRQSFVPNSLSVESHSLRERPKGVFGFTAATVIRPQEFRLLRPQPKLSAVRKLRMKELIAAVREPYGGEKTHRNSLSYGGLP